MTVSRRKSNALKRVQGMFVRSQAAKDILNGFRWGGDKFLVEWNCRSGDWEHLGETLSNFLAPIQHTYGVNYECRCRDYPKELFEVDEMNTLVRRVDPVEKPMKVKLKGERSVKQITSQLRTKQRRLETLRDELRELHGEIEDQLESIEGANEDLENCIDTLSQYV